MHPLFPHLHPVTIALLSCLLVVCEVFGGTPSGDISHAVAPLLAAAGAMAAAQVATKVVGGLQESRRNKKAIENFTQSPEFQALNKQNKAAALRAEMNKYGLSEAAQRNFAMNAGLDFKAMVGKTEADLQAGSADPTKLAQKRDLVDRISKGAADVATKSKGEAQRQSDQLAVTQKAQDLGIMQKAAAQRQAVEQGLAAADIQKTQAITGGIQDALSIGGDLAIEGLGQQAKKTTTAADIGSNLPPTKKSDGTGVPPGSKTGGTP
mgnify:CR=1 FL=1